MKGGSSYLVLMENNTWVFEKLPPNHDWSDEEGWK